MFTKKTTATVLQAFSKAVTELESVENNHLKEADQHSMQIDALIAKRKAARAEAATAAKAREKLAALFS